MHEARLFLMALHFHPEKFPAEVSKDECPLSEMFALSGDVQSLQVLDSMDKLHGPQRA